MYLSRIEEAIAVGIRLCERVSDAPRASANLLHAAICSLYRIQKIHEPEQDSVHESMGQLLECMLALERVQVRVRWPGHHAEMLTRTGQGVLSAALEVQRRIGDDWPHFYLGVWIAAEAIGFQARRTLQDAAPGVASREHILLVLKQARIAAIDYLGRHALKSTGMLPWSEISDFLLTEGKPLPRLGSYRTETHPNPGRPPRPTIKSSPRRPSEEGPTNEELLAIEADVEMDLQVGPYDWQRVVETEDDARRDTVDYEAMLRRHAKARE